MAAFTTCRSMGFWCTTSPEAARVSGPTSGAAASAAAMSGPRRGWLRGRTTAAANRAMM